MSTRTVVPCSGEFLVMPPQQHRLTTTNPNLTLTTTPNRVLDTLTSCNFEVPRLRWYEQLIHIFSSNGLTRTVTSTVYGGTRARRIPPHTIIPSSTLHPSSPSPSPTPLPAHVSCGAFACT